MKAESKRDEMRMPEAEFDRIMGRALGVRPAPSAKAAPDKRSKPTLRDRKRK